MIGLMSDKEKAAMYRNAADDLRSEVSTLRAQLEQERARVAELESNGRQLVELFDDKLTDNLNFSEYALLRVIVDAFRDRTTDAWLLRSQAETVDKIADAMALQGCNPSDTYVVRLRAQRLRNQADEAEKGGK